MGQPFEPLLSGIEIVEAESQRSSRNSLLHKWMNHNSQAGLDICRLGSTPASTGGTWDTEPGNSTGNPTHQREGFTYSSRHTKTPTDGVKEDQTNQDRESGLASFEDVSFKENSSPSFSSQPNPEE